MLTQFSTPRRVDGLSCQHSPRIEVYLAARTTSSGLYSTTLRLSSRPIRMILIDETLVRIAAEDVAEHELALVVKEEQQLARRIQGRALQQAVSRLKLAHEAHLVQRGVAAVAGSAAVAALERRRDAVVVVGGGLLFLVPLLTVWATAVRVAVALVLMIHLRAVLGTDR